MDPVKELNKVASEVSSFDEKMADEICEVAEEVHDSVPESKEASKKQAALINEGDRIVCLNPVQGIYKGRIYVADEYVEPNYLLVKEEDGTNVGIFRADRFCLDNKGY